jgi:ATP-dependent Clp protease adapter protein ClpS
MSENKNDSDTIEEIESIVEEKLDDVNGTGFVAKVIVFNDEVHTFQEVIDQLMKATNCSPQKAKEMTMMIHKAGQAEVYKGKMLDCIRVSDIIQEIDLKTQIIY